MIANYKPSIKKTTSLKDDDGVTYEENIKRPTSLPQGGTGIYTDYINSSPTIGSRRPYSIAYGGYAGNVIPKINNDLSSIANGETTSNNAVDGTKTEGSYSTVIGSSGNAVGNTAGDTTASNSATATPVTYEDYINQAKKGYQESLDASRKAAEETRQRSLADAHTSYMQNLSSYGKNAEQLTSMGLQGSGYSDYINSNAYAQKRADTQAANAQAAATVQSAENTYQDYINQLNMNLANKALEDQRLKEERDYTNAQYQKNLYYSLLSEVSDPNTSLTAKALDAYVDLGEDQRQNLKDSLEATLYEYYASQIKSASAGEDVTLDIEGLLKANHNGNISPTKYNELVILYNDNYDTSENSFVNCKSYEEAKTVLDSAKNNALLSDDNKQKLEKSFKKAYAVDIAKEIAKEKDVPGVIKDKVVDIYDSKYSPTDFGNYASGKNQDDLVNAYVDAAKKGDIPIGSLCSFNYGYKYNPEAGFFIYIGDGRFVQYLNPEGEYDIDTHLYFPAGFDGDYLHTTRKK